MAWVVGWREVHVVMWSYDHRPPRPRTRTEQSLDLAQLKQSLSGKPMVFLPKSAGAGPSGTAARGTAPRASAWTQAVLSILQIQALWHVPGSSPFLASAWGPKNDGPRGRVPKAA